MLQQSMSIPLYRIVVFIVPDKRKVVNWLNSRGTWSQDFRVICDGLHKDNAEYQVWVNSG
jgi:hypothetical protein